MAVVCIIASSCCTVKTVSVTQTAAVETGNLIADLDVRPTLVTEVISETYKKKDMVKDEVLKENAVFEILKRRGGDMLVAPQFKIEKRKCSGSKVQCEITVIGYIANYTNFRQAPTVEKVELREINAGSAYVIVKKSADNKDVEYDKDIIVVPVRNGCRTLDLDQTTLDRVVLNGKNARGDRHARCDKNDDAKDKKADKKSDKKADKQTSAKDKSSGLFGK